MRPMEKFEPEPKPVVRVRINDTKPDEILPTTRKAVIEGITPADGEENE